MVPVRGSVYLDGTPLSGATVGFYLVPDKKGKLVYAGDALTSSDGTFAATTYRLHDGLPVGKYAVTVLAAADGAYAPDRAGPGNRIPAKYGKPATSGLAVEVVQGKNEFALELAGAD